MASDPFLCRFRSSRVHRRHAITADRVDTADLIHEQLLSDAADGPTGPTLLSLDMRVCTLGKPSTAPELRNALEEVGSAGAAAANAYACFSLMSARKP